MNRSRYRFVLATLVVPLILPMVLLWGEMFVSGGTFYQGKREFGHVYKRLEIFVGLELPVCYLLTLALGLVAVVLLHRANRLRSRWVIGVATLAGLGIGIIFAIWIGIFPQEPVGSVLFGVFLRVLLPTLAAGGLGYLFCLIAGIPLQAPALATQRSATLQAFGRLDHLVSPVATTVGVGGAALFAFLLILISFQGTIPIPQSGWLKSERPDIGPAMEPSADRWLGFEQGSSRRRAVDNACALLARHKLADADGLDCATGRLVAPVLPYYNNEEIWSFRPRLGLWDRHCIGSEPEKLQIVLTRDRVESVSVNCGIMGENG